MPLVESRRFFIVRTPVSLNVDRAGFCGIAYNGAIPQPSLTSSDAGLFISNTFCDCSNQLRVYVPVAAIAGIRFNKLCLYCVGVIEFGSTLVYGGNVSKAISPLKRTTLLAPSIQKFG